MTNMTTGSSKANLGQTPKTIEEKTVQIKIQERNVSLLKLKTTNAMGKMTYHTSKTLNQIAKPLMVSR